LSQAGKAEGQMTEPANGRRNGLVESLRVQLPTVIAICVAAATVAGIYVDQKWEIKLLKQRVFAIEFRIAKIAHHLGIEDGPVPEEKGLRLNFRLSPGFRL